MLYEDFKRILPDLTYGFLLLAGLVTKVVLAKGSVSSGRDSRGKRCRRFRTTSALVLCLLVTIFSGTSRAEEPVYDIDIPSMKAAEALNRFAEQTGAIMLFPYDLANARQANAVNGRYTLLEGLDLLLKNTGLSGGLSDKRVVNISPVENRQSTEREGSMQAQKVSLTGKVAAFVGSLFAVSGASAQDPDVRAQPLEEIIVTATKRTVNVQDVPMSVSVLGGAEIEARGLEGMDDYLAGIPGVNYFETSSTSNSIVMRGIETSPQSQTFGAGTTVATYFGETPTTTSATMQGGSGVDIKLVDISRVEVLRGPQGSALGNSSLGGAVRTIPRAPVLGELEGRVAGYYSNTGEHGGGNDALEGFLNLPVIDDTFAVRLVGYRFDHSGFFRNTGGDDPDLTAWAESLGPQAVALAQNKDDRGAAVQTGGRLSLLWKVTDELGVTVSYLNQKTEQTGFPFSTTGDEYGYAYFQVRPEYAERTGSDPVTDNDIEILSTTVEYDFGWSDLVANVSRIDSVTKRTHGGFAGRAYGFNHRGNHEGLTAELRLVSKLQGPWQFLAGLYREDLDDDSYEQYFSIVDAELSPIGDGVNVLAGIFDIDRTLKQQAFFGELSYDFNDKLTLTVGGRAYQYDRGERHASSGWFTGAPLDMPNLTLTDTDQSGETLTASVRYAISDNSMLYTTWSEGFRLGRPAVGLIPAICDVDGDGIVDGTDITMESTRHIDSDTLDNLEVGGKFLLQDGKVAVNASIFRADWDGLPTNARADCGSASYFYVANAGKASSEGVELQTSLFLTEGLRLDLSAGYTNAELTTDVATLNAQAGDPLPGSPKTNGSLGIQYDFTFADRATFVRADAIYRGKFYGNLAEDPLTEAGGYTRIDARAGVQFDRVAMELFVDNLTNVDDYVWRGLNNSSEGFGFIPRPRTVGLRASYNF